MAEKLGALDKINNFLEHEDWFEKTRVTINNTDINKNYRNYYIYLKVLDILKFTDFGIHKNVIPYLVNNNISSGTDARNN